MRGRWLGGGTRRSDPTPEPLAALACSPSRPYWYNLTIHCISPAFRSRFFVSPSVAKAYMVSSTHSLARGMAETRRMAEFMGHDVGDVHEGGIEACISKVPRTNVVHQ